MTTDSFNKIWILLSGVGCALYFLRLAPKYSLIDDRDLRAVRAIGYGFKLLFAGFVITLGLFFTLATILRPHGF
jgi:hypothetical protein